MKNVLIAALLLSNIVLASTLAYVATHRTEITADRVVAREFVVRNTAGVKVGHFGLTDDKPGEVVLLLRDDHEHFVALNAAHDLSGAIVKSGADERFLIANDRR